MVSQPDAQNALIFAVDVFNRSLNKYLSVFIAAGLFSLCHFVFYPIKIGDLTSGIFVGLLCGFAFTAKGSCISAIVPHLLNNAIFIGILWIIR